MLSKIIAFISKLKLEKTYGPIIIILLGGFGFYIPFELLTDDVRWDMENGYFITKYGNNTPIYIADTLNTGNKIDYNL